MMMRQDTRLFQLTRYFVAADARAIQDMPLIFAAPYFAMLLPLLMLIASARAA